VHRVVIIIIIIIIITPTVFVSLKLVKIVRDHDIFLGMAFMSAATYTYKLRHSEVTLKIFFRFLNCYALGSAY